MKTTEHHLEDVRTRLAELLGAADNPALLWSGGRDSTLLLFLAREMCPEISVVQFRADFRAGQKEFSDRLIREWDLRIVYYAPMNRYFVPNGLTGVTLVDEYSLGNGQALPVLRDVVHSNDFCSLQLDPRRNHNFRWDYDLSIVGWRASDRHEALGEINLPEEIFIAGSRFAAPLHDFADEEVRDMARLVDLPESAFYASGDELLDTGNLPACARCVATGERVYCPRFKKEIDGANWAKEESLEAFRARFAEA